MDGKRDSACLVVSDGSSAKIGHYYAYKINKFALRENVDSLNINIFPLVTCACSKSIILLLFLQLSDCLNTLVYKKCSFCHYCINTLLKKWLVIINIYIYVVYQFRFLLSLVRCAQIFHICVQIYTCSLIRSTVVLESWKNSHHCLNFITEKKYSIIQEANTQSPQTEFYLSSKLSRSTSASISSSRLRSSSRRRSSSWLSLIASSRFGSR